MFVFVSYGAAVPVGFPTNKSFHYEPVSLYLLAAESCRHHARFDQRNGFDVRLNMRSPMRGGQAGRANDSGGRIGLRHVP